MAKSVVKQLWGVEFHLVPQGLAEDDVVSFVSDLQARSSKGGEDGERQASLAKLAEQTVTEAVKLADIIKLQARKDAGSESAKILAASQEEAGDQAERLVKKAERDATVRTKAAVARAENEAQEIVLKARRDSEQILQVARDRVPGIETEAKLGAEYVVRRFTMQFVEQLRSVVNETATNILPILDDLMRETDRGSVLEGEAESGKAIPAVEGKSTPSSKR